MKPIVALVVDDSAVMRKLVIRCLNETKFKPTQIVEAVDGQDGLSKFTGDVDFTLVLSDWNMPNMDGCAFIKGVRARNRHCVIGMITTEGTDDKMNEAMAAGADAYITKPFTAEILAQKLEIAFKRIEE